MSHTPEAPTRSRRRRAAGTALLVVLVVVVVLVVAVALVSLSIRHGTSHGGSRSPAGPTPTPAVDLTRLTVARQSFCTDIDPSAVRQALGARVVRSASYRPGDRVVLAAGLRDVAQEFGCTFTAAGGARARAWVFRQPVTPREARALAPPGSGCRALVDAPVFGREPSAAVCGSSGPAGHRVVLRGLFGDAWLSCQLTASAPRPVTVRRAEHWCVSLASAIGSR